MNFVEAVRLVYELANGMEPAPEAASTPLLQQQAHSRCEAIGLICEWLHAQRQD